MKNVSPILVALLIMFAWLPGHAQQGDDSLALVYKKWHMEQRKILQLHLDLQEFEKAGFWDVYDSYSRAIENLELDYLRIVTLFIQHSADLSEEKGMALASYHLKNELLLNRIRKQYFKKFQRALSSAKAVEFMQLERAMRTAFRLHLQKTNPLAKEATDTLFSMTLQ